MRRPIALFSLLLILCGVLPAFGQHFRFEITDANHSILVIQSRINGEFVEAGDEVGVFTPAGLCAGAWVYEARGDEAAGFAAWGDDVRQAGINGFTANQAMAFRFWDRATNHELPAEPSNVEGGLNWQGNGFTVMNLSGILEGDPDLAVSANNHDFGSIMVDESASWEMTIRNAGIDPLDVASITSNLGVFTTDFPDEAVRLNGGQSRSVHVTFSPDQEDQFEGTLTIESNDPDGDVVITLTGVGTVEHIADIEVSPSEIHFGDIELGHPETADLTIRNTGNGDLTVSSISIEQAGFSVNFNGEFILSPGGERLMTVTFDPREERDYAGEVVVDSDDPDENIVRVALTGHGFVRPQPNIVADPGEIDFGNVIIENTVSEVLTLSNTGNQPLIISSISTDNDAFRTNYEEEQQEGPHFRFTQNADNHSILALSVTLNGENLEIDDEVGLFGQAGTCYGASVITEPDEPLGMSAWGDDLNQGGVNGFVANEPISFRYWDASVRRERAATAELIEGSELIYATNGFSVIRLTEARNRAPEEQLETTLEPGGSLEVIVYFDALQVGAYEGTLFVGSNDPDQQNLEIPLSGICIPVPPEIEVSAYAHDFGEVLVGTGAEWVVSVSNSGGSELAIQTQIEGDGEFSAGVDEFWTGVDESTDLIVTFRPEAVGDRSAILHLLTSDPDEEDIQIQLNGSGRDRRAVIWLPESSHDFGMVFVSESNTWQMTVENQGEIRLDITGISSDDGDFTAAFDEEVGIEPGGSMAFDVTFAPSEEREYRASLTIHSNDTATPHYPVQLLGEGVLERVPDISAEPILDFEAIITGQVRTLAIMGMNAGLADLVITRFEVAGDGFSTDWESQELVVQPNQGFELPVTFSPDNDGDYAGTATVFSNDPNEGEFRIDLTGRAIPEGEHYRYEVTPANMSIIIQGATLDGEDLVEGDEIAVFTPAGTCAGSRVIDGNWPTGIAAWGDDPDANGRQGFYENEVIVWQIWDRSTGTELDAEADYSEGRGVYQTNDLAVGTLSARHLPTPRIRTMQSMEFGVLLRGESRSLWLDIENAGEARLTVVEITSSGAPFSVAFEQARTIEAHEMTSVEVTFSPEQAGEYHGSLAIVSDDPFNGEVQVGLFGVAVDPSPADIEVSAMGHDFGELEIGRNTDWEITVANIGGEALNVEAPHIEGDGFTVSPGGAFSLGVGEATALTVTFAPDDTGAFEATLHLTSNDEDEQVVSIALQGYGVEPPLHWSYEITDVNHSLLVMRTTFNGEPVAAGTQIGVFTPGGICAGAIELATAGDEAVGIAAWADERGTADIEGFRDNEAFAFRYWDNDARIEWVGVVAEYQEGPEVFTGNGFTVLTLDLTPRPEIDLELQHEFGRIAVHEEAFWDLVISNRGNDDLHFMNLTSLEAPFAHNLTEETVVEPGGSITVSVSFLPEQSGDYNGAFSFNTEDEDESSVTVRVHGTAFNPNHSPELVNPISDIQVDEDAGRTVIADLDQVFRDPDGDELSFDLAGDQRLGLAIEDGNLLTFTPAANYHGRSEVTITASDGRDFAMIAMRPGDFIGAKGASPVRAVRQLRGFDRRLEAEEADRDASVSDQFIVTVVSVNDAPRWVTFPAQGFTLNEGEVLRFGVVASDADGDRMTITFARGNFPQDIRVTDNGDGTASFEWATNFNNSGNYRGEFTLSDGQAQRTDAVFATVRNVNRRPVWGNVPAQVNGRENERLTFNVTGSDPDNDQIHFTLAGGNLPQAARLIDHNDGSATFDWTPTFEEAGNYRAHLQITDGQLTDTTNVAITIAAVNRVPVLTQALPDARINEDAGRVNLFDLDDHFTDPDRDQLRFSIQADQNIGARVEEGNLLSVRPADNLNGQFNLTVTASDGALSVNDLFILTVTAINDAPFWVNPLREITVREGERVEFTLRGDDVDLNREGDQLNTAMINSDGTVDLGAQFQNNGASGTYTWDTDFGDAGVYRPVFRVEDRQGASQDVSVTVTVTNVNRPPVINRPSENDVINIAARENQELRIDFGATDPDGDRIGWQLVEVGGLPNGYQFNDHGDGGATFLWTPPFDARREAYTPLFRASDGNLADNIRVNITVENVNRPPGFVSPTDQDVYRVEVNEDQVLSFQVRAVDPDNDQLQYQIQPNDLPNGWTFQAVQGVMTFTWRPTFNDARQQPYTPIFTVSDQGGLTDRINAEITVRNVNRAPRITRPVDADVAQVAVDENSELIIDFLAVDLDNDRIAWEVIDDGGLPAGWQFADAGDGNARFRWTPGFNHARQNPYRPVFEARDQVPARDRITVEITVNNVNRAPEAIGQIDDVVVEEDQGRFDIVDVRPLFRDPDGDALQYNFVGAPPQARFAFDGTMLFMNPEANFNLPNAVRVTVTATDGAANANIAFNLTITPVNDRPEPFSLTAPADGTVLLRDTTDFVWERSVDVDGDQVGYLLTFTFIDAPIDTTIIYGPLANPILTLTTLDSLVERYGLGDSLRIRWWVESTDGRLTRLSNQRWRVVIPPPDRVGDEGGMIPNEVVLDQNYPNPFNPETHITFSLPISSQVRLAVLDSRGRIVAELADGTFEPGRHELIWDAGSNPAGIYLFILDTGGNRRIIKGALLK